MVRKRILKEVSIMADKGKKVGVVTHFYNKIGVGIVKFNQAVKIGASLHFKGHATDFKQTISDMEFDHKKIQAAKKGQEVGIKLDQRVRNNDEVGLVE